MGSRSWFDNDKLLPDERLVRSVPARIRTDAPPHWWEGELVLTSDRLFFLPSVDGPFLSDVAYWLTDIASCRAGRRNRLLVASGGVEREFELTSSRPVALVGYSAARWARDVACARQHARPRPEEGQRAVG